MLVTKTGMNIESINVKAIIMKFESSISPLIRASTNKLYIKQKLLLESPLIENEILSGKINYNTSVGGNKIHIYLKSETAINITTDKMISIPLDDIV
jgi:hypothetical protein